MRELQNKCSKKTHTIIGMHSVISFATTLILKITQIIGHAK